MGGAPTQTLKFKFGDRGHLARIPNIQIFMFRSVREKSDIGQHTVHTCTEGNERWWRTVKAGNGIVLDVEFGTSMSLVVIADNNVGR